ncbi:RNA polymerase sigma factor [Ensifer sp. 4252]|uniref:RNA polymerase sigma factor n=1 Tax=Ensifer sp. 4252 TaxID=3373915 RepID=UPI003D1F5D41
MAPSQKKTILQVLTESYGDLARHVARRFKGRADADDVIQDTYLRVRNIPSDAPIQNPKAYLFRMADNVAVDHVRRRVAQERHISPTEVPDMESGEVSADQVVDYRQRLAALERVIADLPPRQREVFLMHKFDGLSHSEIAAELGITRSAVEKLIMKALATCRERLDGLLD